MNYLVGGRQETRVKRDQEEKEEEQEERRRWTMSTWPGETASIWGTPQGR